PFFQFIIMLFYGCKFPVGSLFLSDEKSDKLNPFGLSQRSHLFVSQMRHQRNAHFTHGIVSAALERRNEDDIGIHTHDHFIIKVPLDTYLSRFTLLQTFVHFFVEEMTGARDTHYMT